MNFVQLKPSSLTRSFSVSLKESEALRKLCEEIEEGKTGPEHVRSTLRKYPETRFKKTWCPGTSPLHAAVRAGRPDLVQLLGPDGLKFDMESTDDLLTPLALAIKSCKLNMIKLLVRETRADVNPRNTDLNPLLTALETGDKEVVELLVEELRADVNVKVGLAPITPLVYAISLEIR